MGAIKIGVRTTYLEAFKLYVRTTQLGCYRHPDIQRTTRGTKPAYAVVAHIRDGMSRHDLAAEWRGKIASIAHARKVARSYEIPNATHWPADDLEGLVRAISRHVKDSHMTWDGT